MQVSKKIFGKINGQDVHIYRITNNSGAYIEVTNYGATWISAIMPDKFGNLTDVLLGYSDLDGYIDDSYYLGSSVGRFANRIKDACFELDQNLYVLDRNEGRHSNHSGKAGIHKKLFNSSVLTNGVEFTLFSLDGEGGFPGNVSIKITYLFSEDQKVVIRFEGDADRKTYLNLTNHAYFNLLGEGNVLNHQLFIPSKEILDTDHYFIPTGKFSEVEGSVFDFSSPEYLWKKMIFNDERLTWANGYNQCYIIEKAKVDKKQKLAAILSEGTSGRLLKIFTSYPGIMLYTGNYLKATGKKGQEYLPYSGLCLETQFFPDTPHHAHFPSCLISPHDHYDHTTEYCFQVS